MGAAGTLLDKELRALVLQIPGREAIYLFNHVVYKFKTYLFVKLSKPRFTWLRHKIYIFSVCVSRFYTSNFTSCPICNVKEH